MPTNPIPLTSPALGDLAALHNALPEGKEWITIRDTLSRISQSFPEDLGEINVARIERWIKEVEGGRSIGELRDDIFEVIVGEEKIQEFLDFHGSTATVDQLIQGPDEGGLSFFEVAQNAPADAPINAAPPGGMFQGGQIVRIDRPGQDPLWGMKYNVPGGIEHIYTFDNEEAMDAALGTGSATAQGFEIVSEDDVNQGDTWIMGDAAAFAGQTGSYNAWWEDVVATSALTSGVRDPGRLGAFMADPEVARLVAESGQAGWTEPQLLAELRRTNYYTEVLYPGIDSLFKQGVENPENVWKQYATDTEASLRLLGYERDEDGTFGSTIGRMLDKGIEEQDFNTMAPLFKRAEDNPELLEALSAQLGRPVIFDELFDVMAGFDTGELAVAVERAIIQFHGNRQGTTLDQAQIERLSNLSQLTEDQIARAFTTEEEALLALGTKGLRTTGLSEQDLIAAAFDIPSESGLSAVEIRNLADKGIRERGLSDDPKAQFFQSFDSQGKPFRPGLSASAPERG